jgi:hypothetical protein
LPPCSRVFSLTTPVMLALAILKTRTV